MITFFEHFFYGGMGPTLLAIVIIYLILKAYSISISELATFILVSYVALFFLGLRTVGSGVDTLAYYNDFIKIQYGGGASGFEYGYYLLVKIFSIFSNWQLFLSFTVIWQLLMVYLAARILRIEQRSLVVILYICLLPGFDMLTNGVRQGLAVTTGTLLVTYALIKQKSKFTVVFPFFLHKSTVIYTLSLLTPKRPSLLLIKGGIVIGVCISAFGYLISSYQSHISFATLLPFNLFSSGPTLGQKLDMYIQIEKQLLSSGMKLYFLFLSYFLIAPYMYNLFRSFIDPTSSIHRLGFFAVSIHLGYLLFWWSNYSYRFMYLSYVFLILLSVKSIEISKSKLQHCYVYLIVIIGLITTYGSNNFSTFRTILGL